MTIDSYTKALLHFDGTDASTAFTDESGKTWTAHGNAQLDTSLYRFSPSSGFFDGVGDWIDTPDSEDFNFGSENWTIDFWIKLNAITSTQFIFGQTVNFPTSPDNSFYGSIFFIPESEEYGERHLFTFRFSTIGQLGNFQIARTIEPYDDWHHIAIVRESTRFYIFMDGNEEYDTELTSAIPNVSSVFSIGRCGAYNGNYFNGWIDEFRISKEIARWNAPFSPPIRNYESIFIPKINIIGEY